MYSKMQCYSNINNRRIFVQKSSQSSPRFQNTRVCIKSMNSQNPSKLYAYFNK